ncbi:MAG: asparagine synthase (glutamine-hydrolyzing) [Anaerolineales bacterium]|nr:asparagine synthase (glutamine-hydrolyzing) [Anaerolineales bacterium]
MCGIAGIILKPGKVIVDLDLRLEAMAHSMAHRGPDDQGFYVSPNGRFGLVNRRLAIRDLSAAGHMPMMNTDSNVIITYNGEIYNADELRRELENKNYSFFSHSDTEVILHGYEEWGKEVVKRLRGMFAFAILDRRVGDENNSLLIGRDHLGIKPLYYAETDLAFVFGSELKTILASRLVSDEINPAGLYGYLATGSVPGPLTIYKYIEALPAASILESQTDRFLEPTHYWQISAAVDPTPTYNEAVSEVQALLRDVVRCRLVSDVPLGAFLSGGLDSSAIVVLMREATPGPIRTCSIAFAEDGYDESFYAKTVAEAVGAEHFERRITAVDVAAELENILSVMDQPTVDGINTYFVSQTARQAGLTVSLSGLGGDELFGGYQNTFSQVPTITKGLYLAHALPGVASLVRSTLGLLPENQKERFGRIGYALEQPPSLGAAYLTRRGLFAPSIVQCLMTTEWWQQAKGQFELGHYMAVNINGVGHNDESFSTISRAELKLYTHNQLLRDTDVMSMAHSLEVRVPFLDVRLVEMLLRLPAVIKNHQPEQPHTPKPLLVQALRGVLPTAVKQRQDKKGFTFPFALWLEKHLQKETKSRLQLVKEQGWFNAQAVDELYLAYQAGHVHWSRVWALVALTSII